MDTILSMAGNSMKEKGDLKNKLKWLIFFRILFTSLLLGSTIILELSERSSLLDRSLLFLYAMEAGIFMLSFIYAVLLKRGRRPLLMAYIQIGIDTFIVTLIILVTGGFSSIFSFLYLLVIIYSSLFIFRKGSMIMAASCAIQYGIMVDLEFYGFLDPLFAEGEMLAVGYPWSHVLYKVLFTMLACFAVAFLSGFLSEQVRRTNRELAEMEEHVKRVEKLAYMGEMAANMAHEIKNPLASLAGSIQLLKEDMPCTPDQEKLMRIVLRETDRLSELTNNFLLFARPKVGKVEPICLDKALQEIISLFEKNNQCRGRIAIVTMLSPNLWVEMDPMNLRQIIWNLLLNAAEAIEGSGVIHVTLRPEKQATVVIRIADDGCGISREVLKSIFDPFFTTKPRGTGLGLSIVHSILDSYGSRLDIDSAEGRGTSVWLKLRLIPAPSTS